MNKKKCVYILINEKLSTFRWDTGSKDDKWNWYFSGTGADTFENYQKAYNQKQKCMRQLKKVYSSEYFPKVKINIRRVIL